MDIQKTKDEISDLFKGVAKVVPSQINNMQLQQMTAGKLYEVWVLANILKKLRKEEGFDIVYQGSTALRLKSSPGPINPNYAHFELYKSGQLAAKLWTDVEFRTLSSSRRGRVSKLLSGEYHELDIALCHPNATGRPSVDGVYLAVECKYRKSITKSMLREMLGLRRELSLLTRTKKRTGFKKWPMDKIYAEPASCLMFYSNSKKPGKEWNIAGEKFGIIFEHLPAK